tara:strand:- start:33 stop:278 length:246 start_codon:yes stop_codon:yes gene_type:complete
VKSLKLLLPAMLMLGACSESPIEDQGEEAIAELEKEIEEDAQSLEEAADEAVKALAEDIDSQLAADGVSAPPGPSTQSTEE